MGSETEYGRRLIPNVIDQLGRTYPQREAFQAPRTDNPKDGWKIITFKAYANAINRCALKIIERCGDAPPGVFPTIAYIGPQDARYVVFMVAAVKAGYQALFISPRNSLEGQINLFQQTNCHILAFAHSHHTIIQPWLQQREMKTLELSSFENWFTAETVPHVPYEKTFEQAEWEPFCVLHTSGSTGLPKPVVVRNGMLAISDAYHTIPDWKTYTHWIPAWTQIAKRHFVPMPLFHAAALYTFIFMVIFWETPVVLAIGDKPLSPDLILECLQNLDVELIALPPSILEEMSLGEEYATELAKLKLVVWGGGNLAKEAGERLLKRGVKLNNTINSTEFSPFPVYFNPKPSLWQYLIINPHLFGCEFRQADEDAYELVVVRKNKHHPGMQGFFYTFPELDEYSNKDLYKPHPELEDHWFYYGRADNIIVFSNGEKLNPVTIEEMVQDHEEVKGVLVVGTNRFQPALLLEPSTHPKDEKEGYEFVENIWPLVEKANHETVFHGRIGKEFIMLSNPNKPFIRTAKGNVQRAGTSKLYADEIDQLYLKAEEGTHLEIPALDISSEEGLINSIIKMLERNVQAQQGIMEKDTDFFSLGIDSLQIMTTSRLLRAALNTSGYITDTNSMSPRIIYHNPTPRRLAQYILHSIIHHGTKRDDNEDSEIQLMQNLYSKYTRDLPTSPSRPPPSSTSQTVILTGSTGTLGSHLLHNLLLSPSISHIHCLNRASDGGAAQQTKSMTLRGLANPDDFPQKKIEFHHFNVGMERLGLEDDDVYERLRRETDRIIHNAWAVNYLLTTASFEVHLGGARSLADFAASAERRAGLVFISSVATCARWDPGRGSVPERRLEDFTLPSNGYGRSKFLASLILDEVSRSGDFPLSVIRVGQIAGPEKAGDAGEWNRNEWLPSIISSSLYLGVLPKDLGPLSRVDWTPVERIAGMVLEIGGMSPDFDGGDGGVVGEEGGYFHGVNPRTIQWDLLARVVMDFYGDRIKELIPFREWIERLEASSLENETEWGGVEDRNPGIKLLDTYKGMLKDGEEGKESVVFGMEKTLKRSGVMREGGAITGEMMRGWCRQWDF